MVNRLVPEVEDHATSLLDPLQLHVLLLLLPLSAFSNVSKRNKCHVSPRDHKESRTDRSLEKGAKRSTHFAAGG
jgi:hypothetical protein